MQIFRHLYANRDVAARAWKAGGGRVVGVIGEGVPLDLISAAGFLPYRLSGDPALPLTNVRRYLHASFNKGQSERPIRLDWVEAIIEKLLDGAYDFIDFLVIPYTRKEVAQVHGKLRDVARDWPQFRLPATYLLDRAALGGASADAYNAARIAELRTQLEHWSGAAISDAALRTAKAAQVEGRALIAQMQAARGERISGCDALAIMATARMMPRTEHNDALRAVLDSALAPVTGKRVFVGGSAPDTDTLYRCIEAAGGQVVGENHDWGQRIFEPDCAPVLTYPQAASVAQCAARAAACRAEAAVFFVYADDAYQLWETPDEMAALGIPSLYLDEQPYRIDAAATTARIKAFLA